MPKILVGILNESFYICIGYIDAILLCDLCHQTAPYPIHCKGTFRLGCSIVASYSDTPIGRFGYSCGLIAGRIFAQRSAPTNGFVDADFLNSIFLGGLGEDIGLDIKPLQRLLASLVSATLAGGIWLLGPLCSDMSTLNLSSLWRGYPERATPVGAWMLRYDLKMQ